MLKLNEGLDMSDPDQKKFAGQLKKARITWKKFRNEFNKKEAI